MSTRTRYPQETPCERGKESVEAGDRLARTLESRRAGSQTLVSPLCLVRLVLLVLIAALLAMMAGCSRMSLKWREEVRLSSGQLITVDRTARGTITRDIAMRATGWKPKETTLRIKSVGSGIEPPPVWRSILIPVVLDYESASSTWSVVSTYLFCSTWYDMGRPASPYVQFVSRRGEPWQIVPLQPNWAGRRANLLTYIRPTGEPDLVREADKEVIRKQVGTQFQTISTSWKTNC